MGATVTVVRMEVQRPNGSWATIGSAWNPPGSFSSQEERGRQVYVFGMVDGEVGVWRCEGGVDLEDPKFRAITTSGLEELSRLEEPHEMHLQTQSGTSITARFTIVEEEP